MDEFRVNVKRTKPHVIAVAEVWMKEEFAIEGYHSAVRHDREENRKGGGVLIFVAESIAVMDCPEMSEASFDESVWCTIKLDNSELMLVGLCYRSPSSSCDNNEKLLMTLRQTEHVHAQHLLVIGDFNYPEIDWDAGYVQGPEDSCAMKFYDTTQDLFWVQHTTSATRFRLGQVPSQLDLVFSKDEYAIDHVVASAPIGKSDHLVLTWDYQYQSDPSDRVAAQDDSPRYNFKKGRYQDMRRSLQRADWGDLEEEDVETIWSKITGVLKENIELHVPHSKKRGTHNDAPWWSKGLTKEVKVKHEYWNDFVRLSTNEMYRRYAKQRNKVTKMIRAARKGYENDIIRQGKQDPKKIHRYIRSQLKVKPTVGDLETSSGELTERDEEAAEVLSDWFKSVFVQEGDGDLPQFPNVVDEEDIIEDVIIPESEVVEEVSRLQEGKAGGPDDLPATLLKNIAQEVAKPLTILFRRSLEQGRLPNQWKQAVITPIFKKGSKKVAGNYRPISLTCQLCKVLERIVLRRIKDHLERNRLISKQQHGFVTGRSCQTNLLEAFELWTQWMDEGKAVDIAYLDYQKAFDRVPHARLVHKLSAYGIRGQLLAWLTDFLRNRKQQVRVGQSVSQCVDVTSGVPQGSVLGPTLFLMYINELPTLVNSDCKLFADDTKLFKSIATRSDCDMLQTDLHKLSDWSNEWLLNFNIDKCKIMHCGHTNPAVEYEMKTQDGARSLKTTTQERDLGVIVASNLKATSHCHAAAKKGMTALRLLRMAFRNLDVHNFKTLYTTYVRPHLDYCLPAVGPHMVQDVQRLEKVQRRATKLVKEVRSCSYEERLTRLDLMSLERRLRRGDLIETYKIVTGKVDIDAGQFFELQDDGRTRGHHLKLKKRRSTHHFRNMSFANRVVNPWNELPDHVVSAPSTNVFKKRLDRHWAALVGT